MKTKILWLASWYPNPDDPLTGDFIERHAKAVSAIHDVTVLFVNRWKRKTSLQNIFYHENLRAVLVFYRSLPGLSALHYFLHFRKLIRNYIRKNGRPALIHLHVSYRAGLLALYCKRRYGIRYVVSEHWSVFLAEARPSFNDLPLLQRILVRSIYRNATGVTAVSDVLAKSLARRFRITMPAIIPNVVDAELFYPGARAPGIFTFLHVSQLNYPKNFLQIIEAVALLRAAGAGFRLKVIGPVSEALLAHVAEKRLTDLVTFIPEMPQPALAEHIRSADCLVLYSRYETFGCVVIESLASGIPVVVSDIPAMKEIIDENNGLLVATNSPGALAEKMKEIMTRSYDRAAIAEAALSKFRFEKVAEQFAAFYQKIIR